MASKSSCDVFISYSHKDSVWVRGKLIPELEAHGFSVMADYRDFRTGSISVAEMERAVLNCRHVLLVLTPSYVSSRFGNFENAMAQTTDPDAAWRKVIPLLRENCEIPLRLRILHYCDLRNNEDEAKWALLMRDLT